MHIIEPFYGRKTFQIKLKTLDYSEAHLFYSKASLEDKIFFIVFSAITFLSSKNR
ncbi:hypothetical protein [Columbia Basin potato purple top phytoplasma]|uniref:ATPase n=1 Tax=Columbia Basin potato purple top phytoplasma TaxID=307134 RepID=A0ABT5L9H6_9MOLU|nr:hypothetical protein [Columbia Basin potato purple top phytoplasma]MDC9032242.1 ATPase [Columbia Basin potato purple top phytoplasma]